MPTTSLPWSSPLLSLSSTRRGLAGPPGRRRARGGGRRRAPGGRFLAAAALAASGVLPCAGMLPGLPTALTGSGVARASIMIALDLPTLVQQADHIAVVDVGEVKSAWDARHERIYSTIDLKVVEKMKTPASESTAAGTTGADHLTVVQAGGTVGDIRMTVTGMGTFVPGERSLVFLRGPANHAQVVGMTQGKRSMRYEPTARHWLVTPPDLRQAKLVRPPAAGTGVIPPAASVNPRAAGRLAAPSAAASSPSLQTPQLQTPAVQAPLTVVPGVDTTRELPLDDLRSEIKQLLGAQRP